MPPSELRRKAREALKDNWGKAVSIVLAYILISFAIGFVEGLFQENYILFLLIEIAVLTISLPISFGLAISFVKLKRGEKVSAFDFIKEGFSRFSKSWGIAFRTFLKMLLPIVCLILVFLLLFFAIGFGVGSGNYILAILVVALYIATLIYVVSRGFLYVIAYYIGYDKPELSSKDCVKESEELMKGNRGSYFLLDLSFIGWAILACFTFGIGLLWLIPYMQVATVCFYEKVAKPEVKQVEEEKIEE